MMMLIPLIIVSGLFLMACVLILYVLLKKSDSENPHEHRENHRVNDRRD